MIREKLNDKKYLFKNLVNNNIYFYSDLVWRMQFMIIKGSRCVGREFLTLIPIN